MAIFPTFSAVTFHGIIGLIWAVGLFSLAAGFQCYVCNSEFHENCGDLKVGSAQYLVDCTASTSHPAASLDPLDLNNTLSGLQALPDSDVKKDFTFCRKSIFTVPDQKNGNCSVMKSTTRVIRACGYVEKQDEPSCKNLNYPAIRNAQCECHTEACNDAPSVIVVNRCPSSVLFLTFFVLALILN